MKIQVIKAFRFSENGTSIVFYEPGSHAVSKRCAEIAIAEGWAKPAPILRNRSKKKKKDSRS